MFFVDLCSCVLNEFNQKLLQKCSVLRQIYYPTFWYFFFYALLHLLIKACRACGPHTSTVVGDQLRSLPDIRFRR